MKKLFIFMIGILAIQFSFMKVAAAEPLYVHLGEYEAEENILSLQVGTNLENSLDQIKYKVTLGDKELEILSVSDYEKAGLSSSYIFMVDVSGSMSKKRMENIQATLNYLIDGLSEKDNACLMLVGDDTYTDDFTGDKEVLKEQVANIEVLHEDTNLYFAIHQALDILDTSKACNQRKCLVILSDGQDDQVSGITETEVKEKIEDVNIPICSVVMPRKNQNEAGKIIGNFSRMSAGGFHVVYGENEMTAETIASQIKSVVENIVVLETDLSGFEANGTELYLQVEGDAEEVGVAKDGYNVTSVSISQGIVEESTTTEASTETVVETEEENTVDLRVLIVLGMVVLLIILIVIKLVLDHKKKKKEAIAAEEAKAEEKVTEQAEETTEEQSDKDESSEGVKATLSQLDATQPVKTEEIPSLRVILTRVGIVEEQVCPVTVSGELVIGRKAGVSDLVFAEDDQLSSKHCKLIYDGKKLCIEDLNSLNGTIVNGVPIEEIYELHQDDIIYIGSREWRIYW